MTTSGWRRLGTATTMVLVCGLTACSSSSSSAAPPGANSPGASATSAGSGALGREVSAIRQALQSGVDAHAFPGAVVVVRRGGQTRTVAVGRADVAEKAPMTAADRFHIASVTKSMTAALALQLVAQGRLSLSDTVEKWEPGLLARGSDITVADLLGQTSGLPSFQDTTAFAHMRGQPSSRAVVALVAHAPLMFEPGTRSYYSNTNYMVLGMILEKAGHEQLATLLRQRILGPLGLHSTTLAAAGENAPPLAHGYDHGKDVTYSAADVHWLQGAGGVVSDAEDVARFYDDLFAGKIVPGPLLRKMRSQRPETNHTLEFSGYGLGLGTIPTRCGTAYGHSGVAPGYLMHAWTTSNGRRSMVMAVNTTLTVSVNDYVVAVLDQALCGP